MQGFRGVGFRVYRVEGDLIGFAVRLDRIFRT